MGIHLRAGGCSCVFRFPFSGLNRFKRLREVVNDVVDVLRADAQSDGRWRDVLLRQFFRRHLRVSSGVGVNHETLHVGHIGEQGENLQCVDEFPGLFLAAFDFEGENAACAVREIFLVKRVVGV